MLRSLLIVLLLGQVGAAFAQAQPSVYDEPGRTLYAHEMPPGPLIHGDGWGVTFQYGKYTTAKDRNLLGIDIVSMKHLRRLKLQSQLPRCARLFLWQVEQHDYCAAHVRAKAPHF